MEVALTPELERFVEEIVKAGRYSSSDEVVARALSILEDQEKTRAEELKVFQDEMERRLASLDRGEFVDGEEFMQQLIRELEERRLKTA